MTNNDILRRLRYVFDYKDSKMIEIFSFVNVKKTQEEIINLLRQDENAKQEECTDIVLANFLNGLIIDRRGKKDAEEPREETDLTNNAILMKIKIALNLKAEDILNILELNNFKISKHELSALFRKDTHKHHRECNNQLLRNFLKGLQLKYRG